MANIHETSARRFAEILHNRLGESLHAVLLYGSVARGDARSDSDVDLLVITNPKSPFDIVGDVAYEVDFASQFGTFLTPVEFSPEQLRNCIDNGDPFLARVLEEGAVLYNDGILEELHDRIVTPRR